MKIDVNRDVTGFLKASGQKLVNGEGKEILLRGVGFGSWLLPEGYMWRFPNEGDRPRRIERMIESLVGTDKAKQFWEIYYDRYTSEEDIRQIAAEGFNSVRIPIHWRFLIEEHVDPIQYKEQNWLRLDRLIDWCKTYRLYAVLDLHGAPGGQTGTNIDDSEFDRPDLFSFESNKRLTIEIWRKLAERYKDEWIVAGYDLLNEPLPEWFSMFNCDVMPLYKDIVKAIREVDTQHMIILEGAHWATDWTIFDEIIDDNLMLQFHKYWNNPDTESIKKFLDKREEWNVPIYMGEGGENNCDWFAGAFRLYEDHDISWNFWTWKKMDCDNSPCSVNKPADWDRLVQYLEGGEKPGHAEAERILWEYLDNLSLSRCTYHTKVVDALLRRPPVRIPAIFYGYRGEGVSFGIKRRTDHPIGFRDEDGVAFGFVDGVMKTPNFHHSAGEPWKEEDRMYIKLHTGDWVKYEFIIPVSMDKRAFEIELRIRAETDNGICLAELELEGLRILFPIAADTWANAQLPQTFYFTPGIQSITVKAEDGEIGLEWLTISPNC